MIPISGLIAMVRMATKADGNQNRDRRPLSRTSIPAHHDRNTLLSVLGSKNRVQHTAWDPICLQPKRMIFML